MAIRGPKPKPTAIKALEGDRSKKGLNMNEPLPDLGTRVPEPPPHLNEDARTEWDRLSHRLWLNACLGAEDVQMFAVYCMHYAHAMKYLRLITAKIDAEAEAQMAGREPETMFEASVVRTTNGNLVQNPLIGMLNVSMREMFKAGSAFGLTPADRSRINIPRAGGGNPTGPASTGKRPADFLNRGPRLVSSK